MGRGIGHVRYVHVYWEGNNELVQLALAQSAYPMSGLERQSHIISTMKQETQTCLYTPIWYKLNGIYSIVLGAKRQRFRAG